MPSARNRRVSTGTVAFWTTITAIVVFILAPLFVVAASAFTATGYLTFPPQGFSLEWFGEAFRNEAFVDGLFVSLRLGLVVTAISMVAGVLAAYGIVQRPTHLTAVLEQVFLSPILMPGVVLGLGLLFTLAATGWRGTFLGGVLAHTIIASPFVLRSVLAGLRRLDLRTVEASQSLGAGPVRTFVRIVLPAIAGSVVSGGVFAFVISFDEAVVTLFLTGPRFETLPVAIFTYVQYANDPSVAAISTVIVALSAVVVAVSAKFSGGRREQ